MREDLIQFIWKSKYLYSRKLSTTNGDSIEIIHTGNFNTNQGPDFLHAKIRINDVVWAGHVEVHINASDWHQHKHQDDPNYQNTILHVVWNYDKEINWCERTIPCIELKNLIANELLEKYQQLMDNRNIISCQQFLPEIPSVIKNQQIERMMVERMQDKTDRYKEELSKYQWDWEAMLFRKIAHYIVAPLNCDAMDRLCDTITYPIIAKLLHDPFQLTALFFGTAGFLQGGARDEYCSTLDLEFRFLQKKFKLQTMKDHEWKLLRMRPSHFPAVRLAQLVCIFTQHPRLFSEIIDLPDLEAIYQLLDSDLPEYWAAHYILGKESKRNKKQDLGKGTKDTLIINAISPLLFAHGLIYQKEELMNRSIHFLQRIKPEVNHITHMWKNFNFVLDHAGHSQGGIQLYQKYCLEKKCTSCSIGNEILKSHRSEAL